MTPYSIKGDCEVLCKNEVILTDGLLQHHFYMLGRDCEAIDKANSEEIKFGKMIYVSPMSFIKRRNIEIFRKVGFLEHIDKRLFDELFQIRGLDCDKALDVMSQYPSEKIIDLSLIHISEPTRPY